MPAFTIFSIGDSAFLEQIFIAIAMLTGTADFERMVGIGLMLGVLGTAAYAIMQGGQSFPLQNVFVGFLLYLCMFGPSATVTIEDAYTGDVRVVANVPIGPAAAGGIISYVGYKLTVLFEAGFSPVVPKVTENQFADALKILTDVRRIAASTAIWDAMNIDNGGGFVDLRRSWDNYIRECSLTKVDLGLVNAEQVFKQSYKDSLKFDNTVFGTRLYLSPTSQYGTDYTCKDAWTTLDTATQINTTATLDTFNALLFGQAILPPSTNAITKTGSALQALAGATANATDYVKTAIIENIYIQAASGKYTDLQDFSSATMINQALQQRNTQWAAEQSMFMTIVRPMITFFEGFIYAITPIMAFIIVFGQKGMQLAGKYFSTLIWIQLWMPVLSIINLYIHNAASGQMSSYEANLPGFKWDSFFALSESSDILQHWIATGGLLAASTPAIALMLVYGSAVTATHLAGRLKGGDFVDEKQQTPDVSKVGPLLQSNQGFQADAASGAMRAGQQVQSLQWGSMWQQLESSSQQAVSSHSQGLVNSVGQSLSESNTSGLQSQRLHAISNAFSASSSEAASWLNKSMDQFSQKFSYDKGHEESIRGAMAAYASGSIDAGQLASIMSGTGVVSKAAGAVSKQAGKSGPASLTGAVDSRIDESNSDSIKQTQSDTSQFIEGMELSQSQQASFGANFAESLANNQSETQSQTWADTSVNSKAQEVRDALATEDRYSKMAQFASSMGLTGSQNLNVAAGNILSSKAASGQLNDSLQSLLQSDNAGQFKSQYQSAYSKFMSDAYTGGDHARSQVMAALQTMTNPLSYSNDDRMQSGVEGVMSSMSAALGGSGFGITPSSASEESGLLNTSGPTDPSLSSVTPIGDHNVETGSVAPPPSDINESSARQQFQDKTEAVTSEGQQQKSDVAWNQAERKAQAINARETNDHGPEMNNAALLSGAATNTWDNLKSGLDYSFGGAMAYGDGVFQKAQEWDNALSNMTGDKLDGYGDYREQMLDDFYGDSAIGELGKMSRDGSDAIGGYLADMVAGGKPENMSYKEYGSWLSDAALTSVASGGPENTQQYWDYLDDEIYTAKYQEARQEIGLSDAAAGYYASTFTSNLGHTLSSGASKVAELAGYEGDVMDSRVHDDKLLENYNAMKMEFVPSVQNDSGEWVKDENAFRMENMDDGRDRVILNNNTFDQFVDNTADRINRAGFAGQFADNYLADIKDVYSTVGSR